MLGELAHVVIGRSSRLRARRVSALQCYWLGVIVARLGLPDFVCHGNIPPWYYDYSFSEDNSMTGKTHQMLGITVGLGWYLSQASLSYNPATLGAVLVGSHLAALLPDLDQPAAEIWDSVPFGHTVGRVADPFFKHRNISHSIMGFMLVGVLLYKLFSLFPEYWGIDQTMLLTACLIAYGSHLFADMFTVEGVPLFYPWKKMFGIPPKPFEGVRIMTGKWFENLVLFPILNIILIAVVWGSWDKIKMVLFK